MKNLLLALLAKTLNKPESELLPLIFVADADGKIADDAAIKPDAQTILLNLDVERVKALGKLERESGFSRGKSESLSVFETELRSTYGITDAKVTGKELVEAIVALKADAAKEGKVTDDLVKKHPLFIQLQDKLKTDTEAAAKKVQDEFDTYKKGVSKSGILNKVVANTKQIVDAGKYILSADANKAARQLADLNRDMSEFEFEFQNEGTPQERIVLLDKEGKVVNDAHGHAITFEGKVKELADARWDVQPAEDRSGSGNQKPGSGTGLPAKDDKNKQAPTYEWKGVVPKNNDEFVKAFEKLTDENEQVALSKAFEASQKAT